MKKNRLCELLGVRYPIIQAPMNWICGAGLVAAVSNAGGLGTLGLNAGARTVTGDVVLTGERLRGQIRQVRTLSKEPFAVNIAIGYGEGRQYSDRYLQVTLEEGVPIAIVTAGAPNVYTRALKDAGIKVLHAISTVKHARKAEETGVDAVICEGFEGGGHKDFAELTTFVLVPMVADAVKIPIVAGGGIADTRGLLAALALGADGVYMGTRFMVTHEAEAHQQLKEAVAKAEDACTVSIPEDLMLNRALKGPFTQKILELKVAGTSRQELNEFTRNHSLYQAAVMGDAEHSEIPCGQVAGLITGVESAEQVIRDIAKRIYPCLEDLKNKLTGFSK